MKKIIFLIVIAISFISCVEILDISVDEEDKQLVLNSIISPDSLIKVNISKSIGATEGDAYLEFIYGAAVKLYEDGNFIEDLKQDTFGYYTSTKMPEVGKEYTITAEKDNFPLVTGKTTTIPKILLKEISMDVSIDSTTETWCDGNGYCFDTTLLYFSDQGTLYLSFDDPADENNYYYLLLSTMIPIYVWDDFGNQYIKGYYESPIWYSLENSIDEFTYFSLDNNKWGYAFSDNLFDGSTKNIKTTIYMWDLFQYTETGTSISPLYVHLYSINKDLYNYIISYENYSSSNNNPFSEPVNIYTNIINGFGLFSSFSSCTDSLVFK